MTEFSVSDASPRHAHAHVCATPLTHTGNFRRLWRWEGLLSLMPVNQIGFPQKQSCRAVGEQTSLTRDLGRLHHKCWHTGLGVSAPRLIIHRATRAEPAENINSVSRRRKETEAHGVCLIKCDWLTKETQKETGLQRRQIQHEETRCTRFCSWFKATAHRF